MAGIPLPACHALQMCEGPKYSFLLSNMLTAINRTHIPSEEVSGRGRQAGLHAARM